MGLLDRPRKRGLAVRGCETPDRLRAEALVDKAVGALIARWGIPVDESERRLRDAAQRAGISDAQVARAVLGLFKEVFNGGGGQRSGFYLISDHPLRARQSALAHGIVAA